MISREQQTEIIQTAAQLFGRRPDWVTFFRQTLGLRGIVRRAFPTRDMLAAFEQTEAYRGILRQLTELRQDGTIVPDETLDKAREEQTCVITVRLPKSVHEMLRVEAHEHRTSMNKLCISKLLQFIDGTTVPTDTRRRQQIEQPIRTIASRASDANDDVEGHDQPGRSDTE